MPWFKVDDSFESHPKVKAIPRPRRVKAIGLWTLAGSWSARQLTDGFIPGYMLDELAGSKTEANTLVEVGLWSPVDGGYLFKDWHDWQPTKARVEAERDAAKERMRVARERKKGTGSGNVRANTSATPPNRSGEVRSTPRSVTPTRPDPTRPDHKEEEPAGSSSATPRKRAATRLADDWAPTEAHWERQNDGLDIQREADTFKAHAEANDRRCVNWNAAFTQWLLKARPGMRQQGSQQHVGRAAQWLQLAADMDPTPPTNIREIGPRR
jgi:hypothetical protein